VQANRQLPQLVRAARTAGRFAGRLHGGQKQGYEHANDGNHDEQFNECKTDARAMRMKSLRPNRHWPLLCVSDSQKDL
jgi:hypothetical protein